ncbi:Protein of unknown function [Propionibacterium freudenreichii subsp. freudenreichii]|nr:Hypothetical protein PFREUD_08430 [Propionibacterium freudenreichii subsp. shermanii CIRM-BIA1]CEG91648.1 Protein of unknown function [Propionibacterium freudenreichii]CEP27127.1 Protein of unknown function [Propionibacterium freudenreichii subsp. freudenreichii]CEG94263.1 Protein of unknown function [Propionibacterium freudenreichii]CEG96529.1 Protein of unknown function [Propionibacterium freudenreichii]
MLELAEP